MGTGPPRAVAANVALFLFGAQRCRYGSAAATLNRHYKSEAVSSERSIPRAPPALCAVIIAKRGPDSQICRRERGT